MSWFSKFIDTFKDIKSPEVINEGTNTGLDVSISPQVINEGANTGLYVSIGIAGEGDIDEEAAVEGGTLHDDQDDSAEEEEEEEVGTFYDDQDEFAEEEEVGCLDSGTRRQRQRRDDFMFSTNPMTVGAADMFLEKRLDLNKDDYYYVGSYGGKSAFCSLVKASVWVRQRLHSCETETGHARFKVFNL